MINMLRKGIKFSMQKVYFRKVIFNVDPIVNVLNAKFKSLTFQLRAIWFHTFAVDMTVCYSVPRPQMIYKRAMTGKRTPCCVFNICSSSCVLYYQNELKAARLKKRTAQRFRLANLARIFINLSWYDITDLIQYLVPYISLCLKFAHQ